MLLLLQTVAQQIPPIHVTVLSPPGMPEWVKILISAATGALLGILSNIAMEYVKPWIARRVTRRMMADHLGTELVENQSKVDAADRILTEAAEKGAEDREYALQVCKVIAMTIDSDRFDYFFTGQKSVLYELDNGRALTTFYQITKTFHSLERDYEETHRTFKMAAAMGMMYIRFHGLTYDPPVNPIEEAFRKQVSAPGEAAEHSDARG